MLLAHERLSAEKRAGDSSPVPSIFFLHGIFGRGTNWRSVAKRVLERRPDYDAVLVDLRLHGKSSAFEGPHTVRAAALDVDALMQTLPASPVVVVGHSFGGKVAMQLAIDRAQASRSLDQLWVIDSNPSIRLTARGSESTLRALEVMRGLPSSFGRRDEVTAALVAGGVEPSTAQFLAINFERREDRIVNTVDLDGIETLLRDYFALDTWAALEHPLQCDAHLVVGGRSSVLDQMDLARADASAARVHRFEQAGHWVHVDEPDALVELFAKSLPR